MTEFALVAFYVCVGIFFLAQLIAVAGIVLVIAAIVGLIASIVLAVNAVRPITR